MSQFDEAGKMKPLTLEQLREMDGEPVFVQTPGVEKYGRWVIVAGVNIEDNALYCQGDYTCRDYGKVWLAYAYPLAHIDREAWSPCELCRGKHLQTVGFDDRIYLCGGNSKPPENEKFRFCPKCGRPLTEDAWAELENRLRG